MSLIVNAFFISLIELVYLVGVLIAIGLILGILEKREQEYLISAFGRKGPLLTAWIGTPIHEMGHWIQCVIWRHKVVSVKLLQLHDPDGVLGYVEHKYNPKSLYQRIGNFFIGIGPIISGIASIILAMYILVPQSFATFQSQIERSSTSKHIFDIQMIESLVQAIVMISKSLFTTQNVTSISFWIFVIIAISISSHIALSTADIQNSFQGLVTIFGLLFLTNIFASLFSIDTYYIIVKYTQYNSYLLAFSSIAVLFSLVSLFLSYCLYKLRS
ncbi:hypothetical protein SAMN05444392_12019 [Seinonella peptonophila]|uniref:Uncharacterized protein n=1 Tax=Seinonella peptonophila TaxID=112248 RepID=A0A1M5BAD4_9BACL|nr:hypothetical protein [Seinonella peptonophila]SHF39408.1 hypothetical protein SAMN05444392_12019 [Seinonella peptonophila]